MHIILHISYYCFVNNLCKKNMSLELGHNEEAISGRTSTLGRKVPKLFVSVYYMIKMNK